MKLTEDTIARELEHEANRIRVDKASIWFGTMRRADDARPVRRLRRHSAGIAIAAGAGVLAVGVTVPVAAHLLQPTEQQPLDGTVPQPDSTTEPTGKPTPTGEPTPTGKPTPTMAPPRADSEPDRAW